MIEHHYKPAFFISLILLTILLGLGIAAFMGAKSPKIVHAPTSNSTQESDQNATASPPPSTLKVIAGSFDKNTFKSEAEWKSILTKDQYFILREAGTEVPFTGALLHETRKGTFYSAGCNEAVFRSEQKYDSKTGWPSFWAPINSDAVVLREDTSIPEEARIEVLDKCGNHLGHIFDDGPEPTGKRYCMNSLALTFVPDRDDAPVAK